MPDKAAIILSPFCDNDCCFCAGRARCSADEIQQQVTLALRNADHHIAHGVRKIEISGGDPGECESLPVVIRYLKANGIQHVQLSTNGVRCADPAWAAALIDAGLDSVKIPLYGSTARIHEQVSRKPGCFDAAINALSFFRSRAIDISINSLITQENREDLINLYRLMLTFTSWQNCIFSVPCLSLLETSFYLPIHALHTDCIPLIYFGGMNETPVRFTELPLCTFGFEYSHIIHGSPPSQGLQQPPARFRSHLKDVPSYRLKEKPSMCATCRLNHKCDGFFTNDLHRYGTGHLKPFEYESQR